jgi:uncharacterized protein YigA (DUF484 family)
MSIQPQSKLDGDGIDVAAVEAYLKAHPDFFEHHPHILALMQLMHTGTGAAVSLIERQVGLLREQNRAIERKLLELVQIARENERLSRQLHDFASELLKAQSLSDVVATVQDKIRELFNTDFVSLRLLQGISDDIDLGLNEEDMQGLFDELITGRKPVCGRLGREQIEFLFPHNVEEINSAAIIPLSGIEHFGLLALASRDAQQFGPTMGSLFLSHLGDLIGSALTAHIQ